MKQELTSLDLHYLVKEFQALVGARVDKFYEQSEDKKEFLFVFHKSGSGKLMLGLSLLDKRIEMNDSVADIVYKCTLCGACDANCKVYRDDIDIAEVIEEIRATCVENGQFFAEHQMMIDDLKRENNVFGEPKNARGDWAGALAVNRRLLPLHLDLFVEANPIPVKWALAEMGRIGAGIRLPLTPLSENKHAIVRAALRSAGVLH